MLWIGLLTEKSIFDSEIECQVTINANAQQWDDRCGSSIRRGVENQEVREANQAGIRPLRF